MCDGPVDTGKKVRVNGVVHDVIVSLCSGLVKPVVAEPALRPTVTGGDPGSVTERTVRCRTDGVPVCERPDDGDWR